MEDPARVGIRSGRPWVLRMGWHDLLFAHWPMDPAVIRRQLPEGLELDLWEGEAWLGVVPFRMTGIGPRGLPSLPGVSAFPELNLRTYVRVDGRPGVWFFSLDAASRLAVRVARLAFHLPYFDAAMRCGTAEDGWVEYSSRRTHRGVVGAMWEGRYRPTGPAFVSRAGSMESWLTDRYCLYSADGRGRLYRGEIDHEPWPLQRAEAEIRRCDMTRLLGVELPEIEPHLLFVRDLSVVAWGLERCRG
jgi:uncharacterized protein YqjF (DUF2071 family)